MRKGKGSDLVSVSDVSVSICSKFSVGQRELFFIKLEYSCNIVRRF